jgi:hypothetical protein
MCTHIKFISKRLLSWYRNYLLLQNPKFQFLVHKSQLHIVTCRVVRVTNQTGSSSDDWIY